MGLHRRGVSAASLFKELHYLLAIWGVFERTTHWEVRRSKLCKLTPSLWYWD